MKYKRIFLIVIDSLGVGHDAQSYLYNDQNADTLGHIDAYMPLHIPHLQQLGIANLKPLKHITALKEPCGYYMYLNEISVGKDTMTGHLEMMGIHTKIPFQTFSENGFPDEFIKALENKTNHKVIGNKSASGTAILEELGERQIKTNEMIVYTSADSVLQICGHEHYFGLEELYRCCKIARELSMKEEWKVGRVIARPYIGEHKGEFKRTANRHDYALKPPHKSVLDILKENGYDVIGIGKIHDIFDGEGISESYSSISSKHGMKQTIEMINKDFTGLCFVNLVDFDAIYGHRRDVIGYGKELEQFDILLGEFIPLLSKDDLLLISADHGNDPTYYGSDHTREKVPLLMYSPSFNNHGLLNEGNSFAVIGATILDNFKLEKPDYLIGYSILDQLK